MILIPAPINNGYDDTYCFNVSYVIIRKGDKGKILHRPRKENIGSPYFDGKNLPQMIKDRFGDNTIIESVTFSRQYNTEEMYKRLNNISCK